MSSFPQWTTINQPPPRLSSPYNQPHETGESLQDGVRYTKSMSTTSMEFAMYSPPQLHQHPVEHGIFHSPGPAMPPHQSDINLEGFFEPSPTPLSRQLLVNPEAPISSNTNEIICLYDESCDDEPVQPRTRRPAALAVSSSLQSASSTESSTGAFTAAKKLLSRQRPVDGGDSSITNPPSTAPRKAGKPRRRPLEDDGEFAPYVRKRRRHAFYARTVAAERTKRSCVIFPPIYKPPPSPSPTPSSIPHFETPIASVEVSPNQRSPSLEYIGTMHKNGLWQPHSFTSDAGPVRELFCRSPVFMPGQAPYTPTSSAINRQKRPGSPIVLIRRKANSTPTPVAEPLSNLTLNSNFVSTPVSTGLAFLKANTHLQKVKLDEQLPPSVLNVELPLVISSFTNLTSLSLSLGSIEVKPKTLAVISRLFKLEQLSLRAGYQIGRKPQWSINHALILLYCGHLSGLRKIAFNGDIYQHQDKSTLAVCSDYCQSKRPDHMQTLLTQSEYEELEFTEQPDYESEAQHRDYMLKIATEYIASLPALDWIYVGQRPIGIELDDAGTRIPVTETVMRVSCEPKLRKDFAMG